MAAALNAMDAAKYSILDPDAPKWWLFEKLSTEETAGVLGLSVPAVVRRFQSGRLQFGVDEGAYFCCRTWIRESWERSAAEKRGRLGIAEPTTGKASKPTSKRRDREQAEAAAVFGIKG